MQNTLSSNFGRTRSAFKMSVSNVAKLMCQAPANYFVRAGVTLPPEIMLLKNYKASTGVNMSYSSCKATPLPSVATRLRKRTSDWLGHVRCAKQATQLLFTWLVAVSNADTSIASTSWTLELGTSQKLGPGCRLLFPET